MHIGKLPEPRLVSIQLIDEQGTKYFLKDGLLKGAYWQATRAEKDGQGAPIVAISEGVATLLSVMEHSKRAGLFVASMNAGNLLSVAQSMKHRFPDREIFIYADSDKAHDGQRYGIGVLKAQKAQNAIEGLRILIPPFTQADTREIFIYADSDKAHDGQRYGIGVLKAQKAQNAIEGLRILIPPFTQADTEIFRAITGSDKAHDGQRYGIGVLKAQKAQNAIEGLRILIPPFTQADTEIFRAITGSDKAPTDWNDYYRIWETKQ